MRILLRYQRGSRYLAQIEKVHPEKGQPNLNLG